MGFVYRWHDNSNNKYYVGSHKGTTDDKYVGSGILFSRAYKKRPEKFEREILYVGEHYQEVEELILLTLDAASDSNSYNMKNAALGGNMGEDAIKRMAKSKMGVLKSKETKSKMSESMTRYAVYCAINGKTYKNSKSVINDFAYSHSYIRQMLNNESKNILKLQKIYK